MGNIVTNDELIRRGDVTTAKTGTVLKRRIQVIVDDRPFRSLPRRILASLTVFALTVTPWVVLAQNGQGGGQVAPPVHKIGASGVSEDIDQVVERVRAILVKRQDAVRSVHIKWKETRTRSKAANARRAGPRADPNASFGRTVALWIEGEKTRREFTGETVYEGTVMPGVSTLVSDGTTTKVYSKTERDAQGWGKNVATKGLADFQEVGFQAFLLAIRPVYSLNPVHLEQNDWRVASQRATVNGEPALVLERAGRHQTDSLALSLEREYVPVQHVSRSNGKRTSQLDIEYKRSESQGWAVHSWRYVFLDSESDQALFTIDAEVEQIDINPALDPSVFDFEFPPDTILPGTMTVEGIAKQVCGELDKMPNWPLLGTNPTALEIKEARREAGQCEQVARRISQLPPVGIRYGIRQYYKRNPYRALTLFALNKYLFDIPQFIESDSPQFDLVCAGWREVPSITKSGDEPRKVLARWPWFADELGHWHLMVESRLFSHTGVYDPVEHFDDLRRHFRFRYVKREEW